MVYTYLRKLADVTITTPVVVYTVPADTTTVVTGFFISNIVGTIINVSIVVAGKSLGKAIPIPIGGVVFPLKGRLNLEAADTVTIVSDTVSSGEAVLSVMEIT